MPVTVGGLAVSLRLQGRAVLLVGAGRVAVDKCAKLLGCACELTVIAPAAEREIADHAQSGRLRWQRRTFEAADVDGAFFVVAATGDPATDRQVFAACEERHILCNAADDPQACSVYLLAQRDVGTVTLAAGTNGQAPGLAGRLADEALAGLPPDIAQLVANYAAARQAWLAEPCPPEHRHARMQALRALAREPWAKLRGGGDGLISMLGRLVKSESDSPVDGG